MRNLKLDKIKNYISEELVPHLPLGFRNLEYRGRENDKIFIKNVSNKKYRTDSYPCFPHYKPISKLLEP